MIKRVVKCFKGYAQVGKQFNIEVFYTVPDYYSTKLFTCIICGAIFCADEEAILYSNEDFSSQVDKLECPNCSKKLSLNLRPYPQTFRMNDGRIGRFEPSSRIPEESVVLDVWDLYS